MFFQNKNFKRIVSISAAAVCMISAIKMVPFGGDSASAEGSMTAFEITENMQIGWNAGNSLDATSSSSNPGLSSETAWGNPVITKELISAVKAKGFNTIRIPTTWYQHLDSDNNIDEAWLARVKEVVDYAYDQDMYVILNIHHEAWLNRSDFATAYDEMSPKLIKIWQQIGAYFADYDQHLIFEGMNEPRAVGLSYEWTGTQAEYAIVNKLNADFVNTVRNIDSPYKDTRLLMIPSYCASAYDYVYKYMDIPDDDYIAVSLHAYAPYDFTMNKEVDQSAHAEFTDKYKADLDSLFGNMRSYFTDKDIPVVIGEFSASNYNNTEARAEWAEYYIAGTKKYGIPCVLWDNDAYGNADTSEDHSYINRNTYEWYEHSEPVIDAMMKVINDDSIVWGSEKKCPIYIHPSIDSGKTLYSNASGQTIDASVTGGNCSANYDVSWSVLEGKDVAIKFTGDTPILAFMDSAWDNWTEVSAYHVDTENGIAYYSYDTIKAAWVHSTEPVHLCARTGGVTTITQISIIGQPEIQQPTTEPATNPGTEPTTEPGTEPVTESPTETTTGEFVFETKSYPITLPEGDKSVYVLSVDFEGTPGASIGGGIGYQNGEDWVNIEWSGNIGSDGTFNLLAPDITDIPDDVTSAQVQIWWSNVWDSATETATDVDCEMTGYDVLGTGVPEIVWGDADDSGKLDTNDVVKVMCYSIDPENYPLSEQGLISADVYQNGDGVTSADAFSIQKKLVNLLETLPES